MIAHLFGLVHRPFNGIVDGPFKVKLLVAQIKLTYIHMILPFFVCLVSVCVYIIEKRV